MHCAQYLSRTRVDFAALVDKPLLLRAETWDTVHVLWRAQRLGARPAKLENAVAPARLSRPAHAHNATEGYTQE